MAAVSLSPLPHGASGNWDELVLFGVALALFGGYVLWLRGTVGQRGDDKEPGPDEGPDVKTEDGP